MKCVDNLIVDIHPSYFSNIDKIVREQLEKMVGKCFNQKGYIMKILDNRIKDDKYISNLNGHIICNVEYEYESFIPEINKEYKVLVEYIYTEGIFTSLHYMKILIPAMFLHDWKVVGNTLQRKNETINVGDWIPIVLTDMQFVNDGYQCIGSLKT